MSINIGMHLGEYVLLAADTRVVSDTGAVLRDDATKIRRTSMGLATGTGFTDLLDLVIDHLAEEEITDTGQIHNAIAGSRDAIKRRPYYENPAVREAVDSATQWLFTYLTPRENENGVRAPALRLAGWRPLQQDGLALCEPGGGLLVMPGGTTPRQFEQFQRTLDEGLQRPENGALLDNISHNVRLAVRVIRAVAGVNSSVSPSVQIGLHCFPQPFGVVVSEIIRPGVEPPFDVPELGKARGTTARGSANGGPDSG